MAIHAPLEQRIRAFDPDWDGRFTPVRVRVRPIRRTGVSNQRGWLTDKQSDATLDTTDNRHALAFILSRGDFLVGQYVVELGETHRRIRPFAPTSEQEKNHYSAENQKHWDAQSEQLCESPRHSWRLKLLRRWILERTPTPMPAIASFGPRTNGRNGSKAVSGLLAPTAPRHHLGDPCGLARELWLLFLRAWSALLFSGAPERR